VVVVGVWVSPIVSFAWDLGCDVPTSIMLTRVLALLVLTAITPLRAWEYRIDGDTLSGLLLVRPDNASAWGTVCNYAFESIDAAPHQRGTPTSNGAS
jgi:hypothetical protein